MFEWSSIDTWIVVTGTLSAMACAVLGNYLLLRRMSMMGDAISHAVLPGLAIAFLLTGSRESIPMILGATLVGVMTTFLVQFIFRVGELEHGATMGVIFTSLFALGLILIRQAAHHVDLDPNCVLYGAIELTPLDVVNFGPWEPPRAAVTNGVMLLVNLLFVALFFKELKITSFDPAMASALGINAQVIHYSLMTLVAMTTIAAFESVGSILVIAMLIVPAACAHLLTDRLGYMLVISLVLAGLSALLGHLGAITVPTWFGYRDTSTAGMMSVAAGGIFLMTFLFAPRYGLIGRLLTRFLNALQICEDDILGFLYRYQEIVRKEAGPAHRSDLTAVMSEGPLLSLALWKLRRRHLLHQDGHALVLTMEGLGRGRGLVRSHRLWEAYLCDKLQVCLTDVHVLAHQLEHVTSSDMQAELDRATGSPETDPHKRIIPPAD